MKRKLASAYDIQAVVRVGAEKYDAIRLRYMSSARLCELQAEGRVKPDEAPAGHFNFCMGILTLPKKRRGDKFHVHYMEIKQKII